MRIWAGWLFNTVVFLAGAAVAGYEGHSTVAAIAAWLSGFSFALFMNTFSGEAAA